MYDQFLQLIHTSFNVNDNLSHVNEIQFQSLENFVKRLQEDININLEEIVAIKYENHFVIY